MTTEHGMIIVLFNFPDAATLRLAGIRTSPTRRLSMPPGAIPATGDFLRFEDLNYEGGELAIFRVLARSHLLGSTHKMQIELELVVAHQP